MSDEEIKEQLQIISESLILIKAKGILVVIRDSEGLIHLHVEK